MIETLPRVLAVEEPEAGDVLNQVLGREGVAIHTRRR